MKFVVYKDKSKDWRWRVVATNERIVGASSEGFRRRKTAIANAKKVYLGLLSAIASEKLQ